MNVNTLYCLRSILTFGNSSEHWIFRSLDFNICCMNVCSPFHVVRLLWPFLVGWEKWSAIKYSVRIFESRPAQRTNSLQHFENYAHCITHNIKTHHDDLITFRVSAALCLNYTSYPRVLSILHCGLLWESREFRCFRFVCMTSSYNDISVFIQYGWLGNTILSQIRSLMLMHNIHPADNHTPQHTNKRRDILYPDMYLVFVLDYQLKHILNAICMTRVDCCVCSYIAWGYVW